MLTIATNNKKFKEKFEELLTRGHMDIESVTSTVTNIINEVKKDGDNALTYHIGKFDKWIPKEGDCLIVTEEEMKQAYDNTDPKLIEAITTSFERIKSFHEKQMPRSWMNYEDNGTVLGQKVTPVDRAGLYIPGGKAAYPSSLLMNAVPAIVAGVKEIVVCVPAPGNELNPLVLAVAHLCGIKKMYKVGGASAIAAMAYGTDTIPKVDVITGPGNIFVATAKKLVFGEVNIDMIAGPSEIGILADESANPKYTAIDLLSQAEHDEMASSILITTSDALAEKVKKEIGAYLKTLSRTKIATKSIEERGAIIIAKDMDEAIKLMNEIAPEHLEILTKNPYDLIPKIRHAGAIFVGENTPEPIGDYVAGPNHTLPTGGTAKFFSPLGVDNFLKKSSVISFSKDAIQELGERTALFADTEGLTAHSQSIRERLK